MSSASQPTPSPDPCAQAPPASGPAWFEAVPSALLHLGADGKVRHANAAACSLLGALAAPGGDPLSALGISLQTLSSEPVACPGTPRWVRLSASPGHDSGHWLHAEDATDLVRTRQELVRNQELLDLAQQFGRLGVWERDVRTLSGRWDRHVYKFWGLDDASVAPDFAVATRQVVDADRLPMQALFKDSLQQAGHYGYRFRVRRQDGQLTHLHSQWAVKNGPDGQPDRVLGIMMDDTEAMRLARSHVELESQLALAGSLAGLVVWRHDLRTRRVHLNDAGCTLLQLAPDPDGMPVEQVRAREHPDDARRAKAATVAAVNGDATEDVELRFLQADGRSRHLLTRRVPQRNEQGEVIAVLGVALDITAREEQRRRARELSTRFDLATRAAGIGYWSHEGHAPVAVWNDQMRSLHGLTGEDPVPLLRPWLQQHVHPADRLEARRRFRTWLGSGVPRMQTELRILQRDGSVRHLMLHSLQDTTGPTRLLFGIAIDITDRRLADVALRRADERAALAARGAGIGTWELDCRDGEYWWDDQMWRLRGLAPREQAPAMDEMLSLLHPADRQAAAETIASASQSEQTLDHRFRVVYPDGSVRWLASRSSSLRDNRGQVIRRIGVNWDVTAEHEAELERASREVAEQAHAAKNRFLARVSHELRTPLNAVIGFADLLLEDDVADRRTDRIHHIQTAGRHLLALIDDVLDLACLETSELRMASEAVSLADTLAQTLPLVEPIRIQQGLTVHTDVGALAVQGDPVRLRQVLLNLVSNACKYNRPGGRVAVLAMADGREVEIQIRDTGRGLAPEQLAQLYQPFNRLGIEREGIDGKGIGLTIVKALVERMGGSVQLSSQPGLGTVAQLRLPAATPVEEPVPPAAPRTLACASLDPEQGLLYIEDNAVNALIVQELMQRRPDIRLHMAADGASGLALARREQPALILLDMQLPDADGLTVLAWLRADPATAHLPCIAVSANAHPEDMAHAMSAGLADYWTKPLDLSAFARDIDRWFGAAAVASGGS